MIQHHENLRPSKGGGWSSFDLCLMRGTEQPAAFEDPDSAAESRAEDGMDLSFQERKDIEKRMGLVGLFVFLALILSMATLLLTVTRP